MSKLWRRVKHRFDPDQVTTISPREEPAEAGDLSPETIEAIWSSVQSYYRLGLQPGMSLSLRRRGKVVLERSIGHSRGNGPADPDDAPLVPTTPDSLFNLFSGSKSITGMLALKACEMGCVDLDEPVVTYLPELKGKDRDTITLRQVLSHRAGLHLAHPQTTNLDVLHDSEMMLEALQEAVPTGTPGASLAYQAVNGGFLIQALLERQTGQPFRQLLRQWITEPMNLNFTYGVASNQTQAVAREYAMGPPSLPPFNRQLIKALDADLDGIVAMANDARFLTGIVPSGNVIGTANEFSAFFECLLRRGQHGRRRIFQESTVRAAVMEQNVAEIDKIILLPIRYGLGFMLGSPLMGLYGAKTPKAFGHLGFTNILCWADPERDISVALLNNGKPFLTPELLVWLNIPRTISARIPRDS